MVELPEDRDEIDEDDLEEVKRNARDVNIPSQNAFLHAIVQHYYVDGQDGVLTPVGMLGTKLEADYHIVHGVRTRVQNTIRCIKEIPLEVEDVVLNSVASAQVVLSQNQKNLGVLVIDIGAGTMDYLVYVDGAIKQSGVFGIGGDHVTNDICMGLRIPIGRADRLKLDEGSAILGNCLPGETLYLPPEPGFAGREIERETLNSIIHFRLREAFELLKRQLETEPYLRYLGAGVVLTGGHAAHPRHQPPRGGNPRPARATRTTPSFAGNYTLRYPTRNFRPRSVSSSTLNLRRWNSRKRRFGHA